MSYLATGSATSVIGWGSVSQQLRIKEVILNSVFMNLFRINELYLDGSVPRRILLEGSTEEFSTIDESLLDIKVHCK